MQHGHLELHAEHVPEVDQTLLRVMARVRVWARLGLGLGLGLGFRFGILLLTVLANNI